MTEPEPNPGLATSSQVLYHTVLSLVDFDLLAYVSIT